jgi:transcriptional regulator with XRE-family HTH domain
MYATAIRPRARVLPQMPRGRKHREPSKELGRIIREARKALGLTQKEVASRCGVTDSMIGHIENATTVPSADVLRHLASVLRLDSDHLGSLVGYTSMRLGDEPVWVSPEMAGEVKRFVRLPAWLRRYFLSQADPLIETLEEIRKRGDEGHNGGADSSAK